MVELKKQYTLTTARFNSYILSKTQKKEYLKIKINSGDLFDICATVFNLQQISDSNCKFH